ncbi:MAG: hypothetical protein IPG46_00275 [Actinobacteria bacterium]|jgi:hypothetical protein|nr:hypothetical protein [Actinomycetota bacterium]
MADRLGGDDLFPPSRSANARLETDEQKVRKVFYVSVEEATAIETVRRRLGDMEIGQLHRMALAAHLGIDLRDTITLPAQVEGASTNSTTTSS